MGKWGVVDISDVVFSEVKKRREERDGWFFFNVFWWSNDSGYGAVNFEGSCGDFGWFNEVDFDCRICLGLFVY